MSLAPQYPKGDLRRMLAVLAAIDELGAGSATLVKIRDRTGLDNKTVTRLIGQAGEQAGVQIEKDGPRYAVKDWGPLLRRAGVRQALVGGTGFAKLSLRSRGRERSSSAKPT